MNHLDGQIQFNHTPTRTTVRDANPTNFSLKIFFLSLLYAPNFIPKKEEEKQPFVGT